MNMLNTPSTAMLRLSAGIALFTLHCSLFTGRAAAQNDTLVINHPQKVTIISGDSLQRVIVNGKPGDDNFTYQNTIRLVDSNFDSKTSISRDHWELIPSVKVGRKHTADSDGCSNCGDSREEVTAHLGLGFTAPHHADDRLDFSTFRSWEIFATLLQWDHFLDRRHKDYVSLGFGLDWKNYRMTGDQLFTKGPDGNVTVQKFPLEYEPKFSRIKIFSLTATLRYEHIFGRGFSLGFGPVVNFNTYGSIKTHYKLLGDKVKHVEKNIHQRPVTIDWMLDADIAGFPLYVKYSNNDVLKDGGLKFRSLSFGIYL